MDLNAAGRQKRLKAGTACTNCRRKKLRCTGTPHCARCVAHKLECVVDQALFLKTNSPQSHYVHPTSHSSSTSNQSQQGHLRHHPGSHDHSSNRSRENNGAGSSSFHPHQYHDSGSLSASSSDEMMDPRHSANFGDHHRRLSSCSATSLSSMSPSPSPASYPYSNSSSHSTINSINNNSNNNSTGLSSSMRPSSKSTQGLVHPTQYDDPLNKKRSSKDQGSTKPKSKRRDSSRGRDSDPGSPSPLLSPQDMGSSSGSGSSSANKDDFKSVVSTMSLDGHGQHFHGSSSGFYVCQLSSRYRQGVYPLPMAHLNDSDLWSHSLQMTSERELPSKSEMDILLGLYFRYMYPFAPMFIRRTFLEHHNNSRPDLSQILILNAIFCNACWYSDDPIIRQDSTKYFNRAKIILDETYHVSRVSTIQALLLMSHHQYAVGNYSGGWLYTGMATRIAHDIGLHRQDVQANEPEEAEIRRRVWWAVYIADRLGGGILGRPLNLRDKEYNVQMPSDDWIAELGGDDPVEYPFEPERIISCRLLWSVKLFMQMGNVLNTMHCIEAEINGAFLADISRTQLPQLHNSLTSWFLSLPNELMYTPYTMSPNSNHPPSPPTALMHMFYYTTLTMLHRPYLRPVNSAAIDPNFLVSSRNICTAAATNVCHIADSLMLHGQLRDTCYYGMACLLAAGTVHVHNAIQPTPSNRETTRAGLSKTVKAAHELVKTFPVAESLIAVALDVFASQTSSVPTEMAASFIDISTFVAPFIDMTQLQSTSIGNIYEAARLAKLAKDGPGPAPSIQLRHPYGNFSMPLPESTKGQSSTNLSSMWQNHISTAVAMAAIAFGGSDPTQEQQFFANPLDLPEALRLAPIDSMLFQVDSSTGDSGASSSLDPLGADPLHLAGAPTTTGGATTAFGLPLQGSSNLLQYQQQVTTAPTTAPSVVQSGVHQMQVPQVQQQHNTAIEALDLMQASLLSALQVNSPPIQQQQLQQQLQRPQSTTMMEDDAADPPSPPAISSDDMDMEAASLYDDIPSPPDVSSASSSVSSASAVPTSSRIDTQTQCGALSSLLASVASSSSNPSSVSTPVPLSSVPPTAATSSAFAAVHEAFLRTLTSAGNGSNLGF
ncbi:hypothetical protein BGW38_002298 [Lunasporangiospora selenospora]|uniref:Zn(2)-C6 fungal-type domain-containing protein n=1 Tax=Lunasporangiospora selenospora TaxID=979761 RepID=A0A9P6FTF9_9FUNG|nr:hypothetical protein BGW38_002298 [Lunasporangiospora selenospora]